jgi:hypothetical protein
MYMEQLEELTYAQRLKKKQTLRKNKTKLKRGRKIASRRRANSAKIKQRAKRQAIKNVKKMIAKGRDLNKASASEKTRIEKIVKKRKALVNRAARRLVPTKRKQDQQKLTNSVSFSNMELIETLNILNDSINKDKNNVDSR